MSNPSLPANHPLLVLLDLVDAPLMMFTPEGRVAFANRAAKTMAARPVLSLPGDPKIRALVAALSAGQPVSKTTIDVEVNADEGTIRLRCNCAPKPIAGLMAMSVTELPATPETANEATPQRATEGTPPQRLSLQDIMGLIKSDLGPSIDRVLQNPATHAVEALKERLDRLGELVDVFGEDVLIGEERVMVPETVRSICQELTPLATEHGVQFSLQESSEELPPVYGSRKLLRRALFECLNNAVVHSTAPKGAQSAVVGISMRASGHHLLASIRNLGVVPAAVLAKQANQLFRPDTDQKGACASPPALQIGLPLVQRILQLHGGRFKVEDEDGALSVQLEIPTGAPLRNTHHLDLLQAQIYAEDLSTLMARTRQRRQA